jgi:hypothetical protein
MGSRFIESFIEWDGLGNGAYSNSVLETCARIVAGSPKNEVREMRSRSPGGRERPIVRSDGAKAFRTHVSKSGEAIRLMYWQANDGSVEFANIGPKRELEIKT